MDGEDGRMLEVFVPSLMMRASAGSSDTNPSTRQSCNSIGEVEVVDMEAREAKICLQTKWTVPKLSWRLDGYFCGGFGFGTPVVSYAPLPMLVVGNVDLVIMTTVQ